MNGCNYFIDTNIFLRPLIQDDRQKALDCQKLFVKISQGQILSCAAVLVLAEVNWTLLSFYKYEKSKVAEILQGLAHMKNLKFDDNFNPPLAAELYQAHNIKFADCLIASHPRLSNGEMQIISYDRDFDRLGIKRVEPAGLL